MQGCHREGKCRENNYLRSGKSEEILFWFKENGILKKSKRKLKQFNTADLISFKAEETFGVTTISTIFFLNEEGKFVEHILLMNEKKGRLEVDATSHYKIWNPVFIGQGTHIFIRGWKWCFWQPRNSQRMLSQWITYVCVLAVKEMYRITTSVMNKFPLCWYLVFLLQIKLSFPKLFY